MGFFDDVTRRFISLGERACERFVNEERQRQGFLLSTHHRVEEMVCMDERVPESPLPFAASFLTALAGGVPDVDHHRYVETLQKRVAAAVASGQRYLVFVRIHRECAAFNQNDERALAAALRFIDYVEHKHRIVGLRGFVQMYRVVDGNLFIYRPDTQQWYDFLGLARQDGSRNVDAGFWRNGSNVGLDDELSKDMVQIAWHHQQKRPSPGAVVQNHAAQAIVAGEVVAPWRAGSDFLTYRTDLIDDEEHTSTLRRGLSVVDSALLRYGRRHEPLQIFLVLSTENHDGATLMERVKEYRAVVASVPQPRSVHVQPFVINEYFRVTPIKET